MTKKPTPVSCKIGTIPALVFVWRNVKPEVGKTIKFRDAIAGSKWEEGLVDRVNPDGYFFASRI